MILLDSQLVTFQAIAKIGTVHGAAAVLHLTQTAVTQRLHSLERRLKTTLFIRSRKGMQLTHEGEILYRYCQRINELSGETLSQLHGISSAVHSKIRFAAHSSIMRSRVIPQCQSMMSKFENLYFTFIIDDGDDLSQLLKSGEIDFAIIKPQQVTKEMKSKVLKSEEYILVASSKWKKRGLIDIISNEKIIDFNPSDQMTFEYLRKYNLLKHSRTERHFVNNTESIADLFSNALGYGTLTSETAEPYIKSGKLFVLNKSKSYLNHVVLAWYHRPEPPDYFSKIVDEIK